ncbi:MAG: hypothetical protein GTO22_00350 [Gemmatimonadales bacterium]|nr:hypothetical protein [Gemmatimonadales bacterium]
MEGQKRRKWWRVYTVVAAGAAVVAVLCFSLFRFVSAPTEAEPPVPLAPAAQEEPTPPVWARLPLRAGGETYIPVAGSAWADVGEGLISDDDAMARAAAYIGVEDVSSVTVSLDRLIPEGDRTPFLSSMVNGRRCYIVTFEGLSIPNSVPEPKEEYHHVHTLNALVDAETGQLLKIWSREWLDPPSMRRTTEQVEFELRWDGEEWPGFPDELPKISLLALLNLTGFPAAHAGQLDAVYVTLHNDRPHWLVTVLDTSPIECADEEPEAPDGMTCGAWYDCDPDDPDARCNLVDYDDPRWSLYCDAEQLTKWSPVYGWRMGNDGETGQLYTHSSTY